MKHFSTPQELLNEIILQAARAARTELMPLDEGSSPVPTNHGKALVSFGDFAVFERFPRATDQPGGIDRMTSFRQALEQAINRHSMESGSDTPDFILAEYLSGCLDVFDRTMADRKKWYNKDLPGGEPEMPPEVVHKVDGSGRVSPPLRGKIRER